MVRALRVVTVERGVDPRRFALLPFGGAGPMHAAAIAAELGIERILCPRASGVLSALGLCASERRRDTARTVMLSGDGAERRADRGRGRGAARERPATGSADAEPEVTYEMRYAARPSSCRSRGRSTRTRPSSPRASSAAHEERYGHRDPEGEVVLVDIRLAMVEPGPRPAAGAPPARARSSEGTPPARFGGEWVEAAVLRGEPAGRHRGRGPVRLRAARGDPGPAARLGARRSTSAGTIVRGGPRR